MDCEIDAKLQTSGHTVAFAIWYQKARVATSLPRPLKEALSLMVLVDFRCRTGEVKTAAICAFPEVGNTRIQIKG